MSLSISLLGPFQATIDNAPWSMSRANKIEALLTFLMMEADQAHTRTSLDGLLFPELKDKAARTNLRQTLTRLRRILNNDEASPPFLLFELETVQFNVASNYALDVQTFHNKLQGCEQHRPERATYCAACGSLLAEATELYRGPFLQDFSIQDSEAFAAWVEATREELQQTVVAALQDLMIYHEQQGMFEQVASDAQRLIELEPWHERACQTLLRSLARRGEQTAALDQYEQYGRILSETFGLSPSPEIESLAARIRKMSAARPYHLPERVTGSFVGREKELEQIRQHLVRPAHRLLTLIGPGGIGKTDLGLQLGHAVAQDYFGPFMDGVYFAPLVEADTVDDDLLQNWLVMALANALSLTFSGNHSPKQQLLSTLQERECLLILDNGEYLGMAGRRLISQILQETAAIKFLVTSRERLNLAEEWVLEIEGLPYPAPQVGQKVVNRAEQYGAEIAAYHAIQLFGQRAHQANEQFSLKEVSAAERTAVVHISQLSQGMPLAIELAAAWVGSLSCQQIAAEIKKTIDILTETTPQHPTRHHSIRAVFEHSWQRLSPVEQHVLTQLSVFRGGFTYEAAAAVAEATLWILSSLIDKSLLKKVKTKQGTRYEMHPLLQQFSAEKLAQAAREKTDAAHNDYYGRFLQQRETNLTGPQLTTTLPEIQADMENIRLGWRWAAKRQQVESLAPYIHPLHSFYTIRGWLHEGRDLFNQAIPDNVEALLHHPLNESHAIIWGRLLARLGEFNCTLGTLDKSEIQLTASLTLLHRTEDAEELAFANKKWGLLAQRRGNYAEATRFFQLSLQILRDIEKSDQTAHALMLLGSVARDQGKYEEAKASFAESTLIYRELESPWGLAHSLRLLANVTYQAGDHVTAEEALQEAFQLCQSIDDKIGQGLIWYNMGQIAAAEKQYEQAQDLYEKSVHLFEEVDDKRGLALSYFELGQLMIELAACDQAKAYLSIGFQTAVKIQDLPLVSKILLNIARFRLQICPNEAHYQTAVALLMIVQNHPAGNQNLKTMAASLLKQFPDLASTNTQTVEQVPFETVTNLVNQLLTD